MAKALAGFMPSDHSSSRLTAENIMLRQRVADLEAIVVRLQAENDALAVLADSARLGGEILEPA